MKLLEEKILKDGKAIGSEIVKVDSFLNHQLDVALLDEMGKEIARLFSGRSVNKILTVEASGIAVACAAAMHMGNVPVVFAKKAAPNTMNEDFLAAEARSFTKGTVSMLRVAKKYIAPEDVILIVDDFLATGEASLALLSIAKQGGAKVAGFTAAVEKQWQGGAAKLRAEGVDVQSLAVIKEIRDGHIIFA